MQKSKDNLSTYEWEELEKIITDLEKNNKTDKRCLLVKSIPEVSEKEWHEFCQAKGIKGWERVGLNSKYRKKLKNTLEDLQLSVSTNLQELHEMQTVINTINMEIQRVERGSGEFSLLMICATDFTELKSTIYEYMSSILHASVRAYDTIFFIDKEYLIAVLPGASASNAKLFAKRYEAIATSSIEEKLSEGENISIYIALSTYKAGMPTSAQKLLEHISRALEEGIKEGKKVNQISSYLLGDLDRASMVSVAEKRLLFTKKEIE